MSCFHRIPGAAGTSKWETWASEETFGDGIWVTAEITFYVKPREIKGKPHNFARLTDPRWCRAIFACAIGRPRPFMLFRLILST
eukprot:1426937-Pyramimonas_sp.AAC.1